MPVRSFSAQLTFTVNQYFSFLHVNQYVLTSFTNGIQKQHMIKIKIRMKHFQYFYSLKMSHLINWTFSRIQSFQLGFHQEKFTAVGWNLYSGQKWEWGKCLFQFWDSNSSLIFSRGYCHHFLFHAKLIFGFFSYLVWN